MYMCYIQPQMSTELAQNITDLGQRTKRDHFDTGKKGLSKEVTVIRMAIDIPDLLRQVLDSRHAVQQLYQHPWFPAFLASAPVASHGRWGKTQSP